MSDDDPEENVSRIEQNFCNTCESIVINLMVPLKADPGAFPTQIAPEGGDVAREQKQASHQVPKARRGEPSPRTRGRGTGSVPQEAPRGPAPHAPGSSARPAPHPRAPLPGGSAPGSPRNNEAWAAPAASFAYRLGSANGLRRGFGTPCCHLRARVCASVTAAVAVALAVGGGPGGAQPRGDRPRRPLPQRVAAALTGRARRPPPPPAPAPAGRSRDVGGGAEEAVPQSQPGSALIEVGESMKLMAEVKDSLDINVKQTFIDPLQLLQDKDLKEIGHHLKKLEGRRLDYDYKKKRVGKIPDEEVRQAVEKFEESKELAERSMFNFLENDVEQVSQLAVFIEAALDYHKQSTEILQELQSKLQMRISAASSVPRREYKPRPIKRSPSELNGVSTTSSARTTGSNVPMDQPCCRGLYDFEPENQGELGFKEGDIITLTNQIDENWYEGMLRGESGFFPINYVEVIVPLPQ
uniref:endophilin-A3 n=1 Tax=Panthera onca TaxID=9690 RepID=UPI00295525C0|nr:endophilin-A3 [Panthera onca]